MAVGLHVVALGAVIWVGLHAKKAIASSAPEVTFFAATPAPPPPPPPPPPAGGGAAPKVEKKTPKIEKKDTIVETKKNDPIPEPQKEEKKPEPGGQVGGQEGGQVGGHVGGQVGGQIGGQVGGQLGGTVGGGGGGGVLPFGEGMSRPSPISPDEIQYTREAREAKVSGLMIVKCVITTEGTLTGCRVIKSVPMMDGAVLAALARHRGTPVMFQGRPVSVDYTFNIRLKMPD